MSEEKTQHESSVPGGDAILILQRAARYLREQGKNANDDDDVDRLQHNAAQVLRK
jgi:hypothetical protein